jgi:hypothetical protein
MDHNTLLAGLVGLLVGAIFGISLVLSGDHIVAVHGRASNNLTVEYKGKDYRLVELPAGPTTSATPSNP